MSPQGCGWAGTQCRRAGEGLLCWGSTYLPTTKTSMTLPQHKVIQGQAGTIYRSGEELPKEESVPVPKLILYDHTKELALHSALPSNLN